MALAHQLFLKCLLNGSEWEMVMSQSRSWMIPPCHGNLWQPTTSRGTIGEEIMAQSPRQHRHLWPTPSHQPAGRHQLQDVDNALPPTWHVCLVDDGKDSTAPIYARYVPRRVRSHQYGSPPRVQRPSSRTLIPCLDARF